MNFTPQQTAEDRARAREITALGRQSRQGALSGSDRERLIHLLHDDQNAPKVRRAQDLSARTEASTIAARLLMCDRALAGHKAALSVLRDSLDWLMGGAPAHRVTDAGLLAAAASYVRAHRPGSQNVVPQARTDQAAIDASWRRAVERARRGGVVR